MRGIGYHYDGYHQHMPGFILMDQVHFHGKSFPVDMVFAWRVKVELAKLVFPIIEVHATSRDMGDLNGMAIVYFMEL